MYLCVSMCALHAKSHFLYFQIELIQISILILLVRYFLIYELQFLLDLVHETRKHAYIVIILPNGLLNEYQYKYKETVNISLDILTTSYDIL